MPIEEKAGTRAAARMAETQRRVLIVDDNRDCAEALALALGLRGHEVRTAHDGPSALALAETWRPEAVILDIGMPGMNGYEVARRLGQQPWRKDMRLLALSGWSQGENPQLAAEAGFDAHMVNPPGCPDADQTGDTPVAKAGK
jgi:CheY-like chemotaxis protein